MRHRIVHRRLARAESIDTMIRSARLPGSSDPIMPLQPQRARAADGRHVQRRRAPAPRVGSLRRQLVQERRLPHRLEHVEVVVAGGAVGAEAERDAGRQVFGTGAVPLASFMLLSGLCDTPTPCRFENLRCPRRRPRRRAPRASAGPRSRSIRDTPTGVSLVLRRDASRLRLPSRPGG